MRVSAAVTVATTVCWLWLSLAKPSYHCQLTIPTTTTTIQNHRSLVVHHIWAWFSLGPDSCDYNFSVYVLQLCRSIYVNMWNEFLSVFDSYDREYCVFVCVCVCMPHARGQGTLNVTHTKTVAISKIEMQSGEKRQTQKNRTGTWNYSLQSSQICGITWGYCGLKVQKRAASLIKRNNLYTFKLPLPFQF